MAEKTEISDRQSLLKMEETHIDINGEEGQGQGQEEQQPQKTAQLRFNEFLWASITNLTTTLVILCLIISVLFWLLSLAEVPGGPWCVLLGISGLLGIVIGTGQMQSLQTLSIEIDRLSIQNQKLQEHEKNLNEEVEQLDGLNQQLTKKQLSISATVQDMRESADQLKKKLQQFEDLHQQIGNLADSTGKDAKELVIQSADILRSIQMTNAEYERDLISQIAQDLEFLDKQHGLTKNEFNDLIDRLPTASRARFDKLGKTFTQFAGSDHVVDYLEIQKLINEIVPEQFKVEE